MLTVAGTLKADWIIYTLCITSCLCLTGFGHCFRTYRERRSLKVRAISATTVSEPLTPYMGDYTEVDKETLSLVAKGLNVKTKESRNETINVVKHESQSYITSIEDDEAGYFDLYFDRKEDVDHQVEHHALQKKSFSISSFNSKVGSQDNIDVHELHQEYFHEDSQSCEVSVMVHKRQSYTTCYGDDEDDDAGYFDLYFAMKGDANQQEENHTLRKESLSTSSFNSNVVSQDNTEFYEPLSEYCQEGAHACQVSGTVHERQYNIACNEDDEVDGDGYFDLYFHMKEDINHQVEHHALRQESLSISSFNSKVGSQDNTEFLKPLSEYCQGGSHAREVSLKDKQCIKRSSRSSEDAASNMYANVYQLLQKDKKSNIKADEKQLSPDSDIVFNKTLKTAIPSTYRTGSLQDDTNKCAKSMNTIDPCDSIEYNKDKSINEKK
ncbi:unnamed protein product [Mytilus edulis]|uniref:Uncharacterized protein n=1 Tax=Mytilus edulis TaxID=6550 RepID=A0A8S3T4Q5_MYTED|nr:unnamed protein product [Mytilus edulis]